MHSPQIEYSTRADCPGKFFRCDKQRAVLSVTSCSKMWEQANAKRKDPCDRLHHCHGCEIGAAHSGVEIIRSSELYGARICSRCHRPSARLIHDELCPSCYNRQREVEIGRNGKGTAPIKHANLQPCRVVIATNGRVQERRLERAIDTAEAIVSVLRHVQGAVVFGFRSHIIAAAPRPVQLELF